MSDNLRRYRAIRDALIQGYPGQLPGPVARHVTTLAAMISGIVGSQRTQLPSSQWRHDLVFTSVSSSDCTEVCIKSFVDGPVCDHTRSGMTAQTEGGFLGNDFNSNKRTIVGPNVR